MVSKKVWVPTFLAMTVTVVGFELWAGLDKDPNTVPWTDLIVDNVPAPVTMAAIGILVAWLVPHFASHYRAKEEVRHGGIMALAPMPGEPTASQPLLTRAGAVAGAQIVIGALVSLNVVHLTTEQQLAVATLAGVLAPIIVGLWTHRHVYSPATVSKIANRVRAEDGLPPVR